MAFERVKIFVFLLCATILVGVSAFAQTKSADNISVRIGIFNSQDAAQSFFESLPADHQKEINHEQLWLNAYNSVSGFVEHHLEIARLNEDISETLCLHAQQLNLQCIRSVKVNWKPTNKISAQPKITAKDLPTSLVSAPRMLRPLGLHLAPSSSAGIEGLNLALEQTHSLEEPVNPKTISSYGATFSLEPQIADTPEARAAKAAYETARNNFLSAVQNIGDGINAGNGDEAARDTLISLGREAFEAAGSAYLSGFLEKNIKKSEALSDEDTSGETFIHHVKENMADSALSTVESLVSDLLSASTGQELQSDLIQKQTDSLILSGARGVIDAGLAAARKSDLYALRHLELEYNLNNFEDSYFSILTTQPIYQSPDLRHNVFVQGGGIINEQSVDIDDDVARHTLNIGGAYRYLTVDERYLLGANLFYDHQWPHNHSRVSVGVDAKAENLNLAANYYYPLSGWKDSRRDSDGNEYEERALEGYDVEVGYNTPFLPALSIFGKGYQYYRKTDEDIRGLELSAEYQVHDHFLLKGSLIEENGGRDGVELSLQYSVPLYDTEKPNLALADIEPAIGNPFASQRAKIFEKVRRENRIRVEERLKVDLSAPVITAQFSGLSVGLPFDVGGILTGALVDLPFDTAITIPNGDFGIISFSNGAIANLSASGGGDVIVEFNNTTLTVTATNGGFVQFISASGGITVINVPGGTVNLLGTDIDVTDDGTTTTIQVRAGMIEVVPDVGVAVINGNQADVVSLTIATGATSLLVNPALETRQEAAYTNLDLINPDPPTTNTSAPFINVAPALITGPQFVGNDADLRLTFTQPVTVAGAPFINGLIDANPRTFAYNAGASSSTQLVFRHTYIAGDVGSAAITIQDLDLNGGTIIGTNNTLNAITAYTDTVVPINDLTAPSLTGSTPVDNEPAFSPSSDIVLNFNENIQAGIGNITLTDTTDGSDTRIIPIGDAQISIVGSTLTFNPTVNLELITDYDLTFGAGVIEDTAGNDFVGISSGQLNFTTANGTVPMFVSVTPPADGTYTNGQNLDWTLNYDQAVTVTGGPPTIDLTLDTGLVSATLVGGSGTANLLFRYTVALADGDTDGVVLADVITPAGATLVDTISMTQNAETDFTAENVATPNVRIDQAPLLAGSAPVDNATGESIGIDITLTFNENVQAGAGNIVFTDTDDGSGDFTIPVGDARVGIVGNVVTIDLSAQLLEFNTNYEITMAAGVFEDTGAANLPFAGLASGDLNWQTVVDPTAGFPAPTATLAPNTTGATFAPANLTGTWQTTIDVGATPDGLVFESGGTGRGIGAAFDGTGLTFAAGDGLVTTTTADTLFGTLALASIPQGLHHFVFVAKPTAPGEIGIYMDGIRMVTGVLGGAMDSGQWSGGDVSGYGLVNNSVRAGIDTSPVSGLTLTNNLSFYSNIAPADF